MEKISLILIFYFALHKEISQKREEVKFAAQQQRILDSLQSRLEVIPPKGGNKVLIAHSFPEGIGLGQIQDMGTVIVRPRGQGNGYEVVAKLSLTDLLNLERC